MTTEIVPKNTDAVKNALTAAPDMVVSKSLKALLGSTSIKARFEEMLKTKAAGFMSSVLSAVAANKALQTCDPMTVIQAAAIAAALDLPINGSLGMAHIVPYKGAAAFQLGWKGYVQLAMRSGQYRTINLFEAHEGQVKSHNPFTGQMEFDLTAPANGPVVGYGLYFSLINGYEKYFYMTVAEVTAHAKKFSMSFGNENGQWKKNFPAMALKTVAKMGLSKYGILSIEMQTAVVRDQSVSTSDDAPIVYPDGKDAIIEGEAVTEPAA